MSGLEFLKEMQKVYQNGVDFHTKKLQSAKENLEAVNALIKELAGKDDNSHPLQ